MSVYQEGMKLSRSVRTDPPVARRIEELFFLRIAGDREGDHKARGERGARITRDEIRTRKKKLAL